MTTVNTKALQQQVLDDFAFHLGYDRDHSTGNYKRDLYYTSHSPFRRLNYNTMVLIYNHAVGIKKFSHDSYLFYKVVQNLDEAMDTNIISRIIGKALTCPTPITQLYLQRSKKQNKILCHKHQIKFSSCEAGQMMKDEFEKEVYPNG